MSLPIAERRYQLKREDGTMGVVRVIVYAPTPPAKGEVLTACDFEVDIDGEVTRKTMHNVDTFEALRFAIRACELRMDILKDRFGKRILWNGGDEMIRFPDSTLRLPEDEIANP